MHGRNALLILLSLGLYLVGLYGFWKLLEDRQFHWGVVAFPFAVLLMAVVPVIGRKARPVVSGGVLEEDRTE
jgi:hypothetical protein